MPIFNASQAPNDSTSTAVAKKKRNSCTEKLNKSRKLFNLSRKRVETLKRSYSFKRFRAIEKPSDDAWVTSGRLGSRDAVLVFRTSILNSRAKKSVSEKPSDHSLEGQTGSAATDAVKSANAANGNATTATTPLPPSSAAGHGSDAVPDAKNVLPVFRLGHRGILERITRYRDDQDLMTHESSFSSSNHSLSTYCDDSFEDPIYAVPKRKVEHEREEKLLELDTANGDESNEEREDSDNEDDDENCVYSDNMPAYLLKISYKFMQTETKLLRKIFMKHGLSEVQGDQNFSILWTGVHMKPDILRNLAPYQRVNHFPRSYELTRKDRLYKNIERMQHLRGFKHFDIIPQSFLLPLEYRDLVSAHNKYRGPWIVKPNASSRGRGIFIVNTPDQIPQDEQVLVSKYISDPLCIDGHKCDLRVYVLVTSFDPLVIYLYEEGLVRLATVKYDRKADNLWNPCMHLCNYSINKYHSDYIKSSDAQDEDVGHKWTLSALLRHLKLQGCDTRQLMLNIEDLIIKSLLACAQSIVAACRMFVPNGNNCFELYGFDILIDDTLKPWLLEINLSPSMGIDSPLDTKVKACLVVDLLTCVGIPAYNPAMRAHFDSKWSRFRNVSCLRRTCSADTGGSNNSGNSSGAGPINGTHRRVASVTPAAPCLTLEEQRIVRNAQLQHARRGGFVRIFPTEDSMQRYSAFLDSATGIPLSTPIVQGQMSYSMILPHNYNQMLFNNLFGKDARMFGAKDENRVEYRMYQYERVLETDTSLVLSKKRVEIKCVEASKRLRKQILKLIDGGSELTQLQARQTFALYLDSILRRLTQEPRDYHEKLILKFLNRIGGVVKAPVLFRSPHCIRSSSKARTAMIAKLLGDFLEQYNRDTEAYVDSFDHYGMIPRGLYNEFLSQALEVDLEYVLALHTNVNGTMPYLYNRYGLSVPPTPPIPSGVHGFLKALPAMVTTGSGARDFNKYEGYYKELAGIRHEKLPEVLPNRNKKLSVKR